MSNETKQPTHTQGEWKLGSAIKGDEYATNILNDEGRLIAQCTPNIYFNADTQEANAKRIVKCVNMHDELMKVMDFTDRFFDEMPKGQFGKIVCNVGLMNEMFLAITRAKQLLKQAEQE